MTGLPSTTAAPLPLNQPTPSYDTEKFQDRLHLMGHYVRDQLGGSELRVLEAGCGRHWTLGAVQVPGMDVQITGVDANDRSLRMRVEEVGDLHEAIVGDLRTVELRSHHYHAVFCSWVLEHIAGAELVLDRLFSALAPEGVMLLRIPDRDSVYGFLTRIAPFRAHVAYKRYIRRRPNAGRPGFGPFPTVYDKVVSYRGIRDYCERHGIQIEAVYASNFHLRHFGRYAPIIDRSLRAIAFMSAGRLTADHSNLAFVLRKQAEG